MNERKRDDNKILIIVLCVLTVVMVGLIIGVVTAGINKYNQSISVDQNSDSNEQSDDGDSEIAQLDGSTEPMDITDEAGQEGEGEGNDTDVSIDTNQIEIWLEKADTIKARVSTMSVEDALLYLDSLIDGVSDINEKFNIRTLKINVLNNANRSVDALAVITDNSDLSELDLWMKYNYYEAICTTYRLLGYSEEHSVCLDERSEMYKTLWGEPQGSY